MAKEFKTLDEALEAQAKQKKEVEKVKKELTTYFTKNKLKRNEDYTDDPKHGPKIAKLEKEIDKKEETMAKVNEQVKNLEKGKKGGKAKGKAEKAPKKGKEAKGEGRTTKYEYPADCDTPQKKKAFRVAARAAEKKGEPFPESYKEVMAAKESKPKKGKEKEEKVEKKAKTKTKEKEAPAKGKKAKAKKEEAPKEKASKKKKAKKVEDD